METIRMDDWVFKVDRASTERHYQSMQPCDCSTCQNYHATVGQSFPQVARFLMQFGVDIKRPDIICLMKYKGPQKIADYTVYYSVQGIAALGGGYEIDLDSVNIVVHQSDRVSIAGVEEPYFVLEVWNIIFPYDQEDSHLTQCASHKPNWSIDGFASEPSLLPCCCQQLHAII